MSTTLPPNLNSFLISLATSLVTIWLTWGRELKEDEYEHLDGLIEEYSEFNFASK